MSTRQKNKVRLGDAGLGGRCRYFLREYERHPEAEVVAAAELSIETGKPVEIPPAPEMGF